MLVCWFWWTSKPPKSLWNSATSRVSPGVVCFPVFLDGKIKNYFFSIIFLFLSIIFYHFSLFFTQQVTNHTIWWHKWTLRPKLPLGHLGWQLLKPLGSETTVNQHIPFATISYTTTLTTLSVTCHCLHSPAQPNTACTAQHSLHNIASCTLPHGCALVLILYFLIFYHSYVHTSYHSLMAV